MYKELTGIVRKLSIVEWVLRGFNSEVEMIRELADEQIDKSIILEVTAPGVYLKFNGYIKFENDRLDDPCRVLISTDSVHVYLAEILRIFECIEITLKISSEERVKI